MSHFDRRELLKRSAGTAAWTLLALSTGELGLEEALASLAPDSPFAGGEFLGTLPFLSEGDLAVGEVVGSGLTGRLALNLFGIDPEEPVVSTEDFYVRTLPPTDLPPAEGWSIGTSGLVAETGELGIEEVRRRARPLGEYLLECSGNSSRRRFGLLSAAVWSGVPVTEIFEDLPILDRATRVEIVGHDEHAPPHGASTPGASWNFSLERLLGSGAFLATGMNGEPLPPVHGQPVRLVVPNWYGCCLIKWVTEIRFVDDSAPATSQMRDFASRTHQRGTPELARDYRPAVIELAAMPVRVEKWRTAQGEPVYRLAGIVWGGGRKVDRLEIRFGEEGAWQRVARVERRRVATWGFWCHPWSPPGANRYTLRLRPADRKIPARRLDAGYYDRRVEVGDA